jgi:hypothetical protein
MAKNLKANSKQGKCKKVDGIVAASSYPPPSPTHLAPVIIVAGKYGQVIAQKYTQLANPLLSTYANTAVPMLVAIPEQERHSGPSLIRIFARGGISRIWLSTFIGRMTSLVVAICIALWLFILASIKNGAI